MRPRHMHFSFSRSEMTLREKLWQRQLVVRPAGGPRLLDRLPHSLFGGQRQCRPLGVAPDDAFRRRPGGHAGGRDDRYPDLDALGLRPLRDRPGAARRRRDPGFGRHGRSTLDRSRLHPAAAVRNHEDHHRSGPGPLFPRRQLPGCGPPAVPASAAHDGCGAGRPGLEAARSGHRDDADPGQRRHVLPGRRAAVEVRHR